MAATEDMDLCAEPVELWLGFEYVYDVWGSLCVLIIGHETNKTEAVP